MKIITYAQAERASEGARLFYERYIREAAEQAGSVDELSRSLGLSRWAVHKTLERGEAGALRRMAKRIHNQGQRIRKATIPPAKDRP